MFSGIIENIGTVVDCRPKENGLLLRISTLITVAPKGEAGVGTIDRERIGLGDSIAVNGVCLTVEEVFPPKQFSVVCGKETVDKTKMSTLYKGQKVNIERARKVGDRLDGHIVQGHVDDVGKVIDMSEAGESWILWIEAPLTILKYIAVKGSICIDGVSLTVNAIVDNRFRCNIIPYTIQETALGILRSGDIVNLEVDVIARYLERLIASPNNLTTERLLELGYASHWSQGGKK
jgi:riboflavin synthase